MPKGTKKADYKNETLVVLVCQPLECAVNEGVDLSAIVNREEVGSDSTSQNFEAANKEECCLRCQEIPSKTQSFFPSILSTLALDCRAWTYFNSKMLCWTISHPQLGIHSCSDCSSSILAFRYVIPEDRAILTVGHSCTVKQVLIL